MFVPHRKHVQLRDRFTSLYVDDVRTSQGARPATGIASLLLYVYTSSPRHVTTGHSPPARDTGISSVTPAPEVVEIPKYFAAATAWAYGTNSRITWGEGGTRNPQMPFSLWPIDNSYTHVQKFCYVFMGVGLRLGVHISASVQLRPCISFSLRGLFSLLRIYSTIYVSAYLAIIKCISLPLSARVQRASCIRSSKQWVTSAVYLTGRYALQCCSASVTVALLTLFVVPADFFPRCCVQPFWLSRAVMLLRQVRAAICCSCSEYRCLFRSCASCHLQAKKAK
jgi:hypothetical protein